MEIWTIQNEKILEEIDRRGFYRPSPPFCMDNTECSPIYFRLPYRFMIDCLYEKCGLPLGWTARDYTDAVIQDNEALSRGWTLIDSPGGFLVLSCAPSDMPHPVWGWAKRAGRGDGKPDMRRWRTTKPEQVVRLKLEIPEERLLLSDFDAWHIPLNLGFMPPRAVSFAQAEEIEKELDRDCRKIGLSGASDLFSEKTGLMLWDLTGGGVSERGSGNENGSSSKDGNSKDGSEHAGLRDGQGGDTRNITSDNGWRSATGSASEYDEARERKSDSSSSPIFGRLPDKRSVDELQRQVAKSWRECLVADIGNGGKFENGYFPDIAPGDLEIQCVFWEIRDSDIISAERFQTRAAGRAD